MTDYSGSLRTLSVIGAAGFVNVAGPLVVGIEPTPPDPPDITPPVVVDVFPAASTAIDRFQSLQLDVTDETALAGVFVFAAFASGVVEVVHDGDAFTATYASSTRTTIEGGYRYTLRRVSGWPSAVTIKIRALDTRGNAA